MKYKPKPADLKDVDLPKEIEDLSEEIAKNVHEVWAFNRINEGWTYGETRDDKNLKTPCLVEYEELPEFEKDYDRNTAKETLKLIIKLGYEIKKKEN